MYDAKNGINFSFLDFRLKEMKTGLQSIKKGTFLSLRSFYMNPPKFCHVEQDYFEVQTYILMSFMLSLYLHELL